MLELSVLDNLPDISLFDEEEITVESLIDEAVEDFEERYKEITGEEITLYPADEYKILLQVAAGKVFQILDIANERFKRNFIKYMTKEDLKNWGANFGYLNDGTEYARTVLCFYASKLQDSAISIPKGTRATAGDNVFFETEEYAEIVPGETCVEVHAVCTVKGAIGNGYTIGQINTIVDPINLISKVENVTISDSGHDEWTEEELRYEVLNYPALYSTAGPEDGYIALAKSYSPKIIDAKVITSEDAEVHVYILLENGEIPDETYCQNVQAYMREQKISPGTDRIIVKAPEIVEYTIDATYYISEENRDVAGMIQSEVEDAANVFVRNLSGTLGKDINPDDFIAYAKAVGVRRIVINSPQYATVGDYEVAKLQGDINLKYGGMEDE